MSSTTITPEAVRANIKARQDAETVIALCGENEPLRFWESTCPACWGRGCIGRTSKCGKCDGDGFLACDENAAGAHWHDFGDEKGNLFRMDCAGCEGSGYVSPDGRCDYCGGSGNTDRPALQRIGNLVVAGHYDSRVRGLGEVEYSICVHEPIPITAPSILIRIVKFRGDGFEGLLMPIDMSARSSRLEATNV